MKKKKEQKKHMYVKVLVINLLEMSFENLHYQLPNIGVFEENITPTEKGEKIEAIQNMRTQFQT